MTELVWDPSIMADFCDGSHKHAGSTILDRLNKDQGRTLNTNLVSG